MLSNSIENHRRFPTILDDCDPDPDQMAVMFEESDSTTNNTLWHG